METTIRSVIHFIVEVFKNSAPQKTSHTQIELDRKGNAFDNTFCLVLWNSEGLDYETVFNSMSLVNGLDSENRLSLIKALKSHVNFWFVIINLLGSRYFEFFRKRI